MNIFLYIMLFIMGTFFGSFFTLAVYRIPLKKDITHERSFCPNCNHRLEALDLIPVWSYIFLGGKCRYCGEKIRIRYLLLEILSGIVFITAFFSLHIQNILIDTQKLIYYVLFVFVYVTTVLIAGIDKEYRKINKSVLLFGFLCHTIYITYLCIIGASSMYRYIICGVIFVLIYILLTIIDKLKDNYFLQVLLYLSYILFVVGLKSTFFIIILSMIVLFILKICLKKSFNTLPIGFCISLSTVCIIIVENIVNFWLI